MSKLDSYLLDQLDQLKNKYLDKSLEVVVKKLLLIQAQSNNSLKINYKCSASLAFPAREIQDITWQEEDGKIIVVVSINFFGLQSVNSPLPLNLHEQVVHDINSDSFELNDFYNFFNNRLIELLIDSLLKKNVLARNNSIVKDIWPNILGLALQIYSDDKQVFYRLMKSSALLLGSRLSANNIAKLIEIFFDFDKVRIENFTPRTIRLQDKNLTKLSEKNSGFDGGFVLGGQTIDIQNSCRFDIYLQKADDFLPNGNKNAVLNKLIRFLLPKHVIYSISLHLPENIPMILSQDNVYLGWTTIATEKRRPQTIYLEGI